MADPTHDHQPGNIRVAFFLNLAFTLIEIVGGLLTNSVAILADAAHDLGDTLSLGLGWFLDNYAQRSASDRYTYGYRRYSLLGALINALILTVGSVFILTETVPRLLNPEPTRAPGMIALAVVGVAVNGLAYFRLRGGASHNEQILSLHLLEDVGGWAVVLLGSVIMLFTGWRIIDPLLSLGITAFILFNVVRKLASTVDIFLQATPEGVDLAALREKITQLDDVLSTHHTHIWSLDGEHHVMSTHIVVPNALSSEAICQLRTRISQMAQDMHCEHVTIQVERRDDPCQHLTTYHT